MTLPVGTLFMPFASHFDDARGPVTEPQDRQITISHLDIGGDSYNIYNSVLQGVGLGPFTVMRMTRHATGKKIPRLTGKEFEIVKLLVERGEELYGLQLVAESGGSLSRGSVYVLLDRLEEKGFVDSRQEEKAPGVSGLPRRLYKPTASGVQALRYEEQYASWMGFGAAVLQ